MHSGTFDVLQKDLEVQRYAFVEASAGTGKTFAIEHLVTRLVLEGIPLRRILVMTFTNAAKTELIRRIYQRLLARLKDSTPEEKRLIHEALQTFHEARITTIHGFCQMLLRQFSFEAEISSSFFEGQSREQRFENIQNYLQGHLENLSISLAQMEVILNSCRGVVVKLFEKIAEKETSEVTYDLPTFHRAVNEVLGSIGSVDPLILAEDFEIIQAAYNKISSCVWQFEKISIWLQKGRAELLDLDEFLLADTYFWDLICEENRNKKKKQNTPLYYLTLFTTMQDKLTPLFDRAKNPHSILQTLANGYAHYRESFAGAMESPDDLLTAMSKAIEKPRFFQQVRQEFDAAIIDEFQDTDAVQWAIFEKLFLRDRPLKALYLVGDPKQSIYAFRKADLYSYLRAREAFTIDERMHLSVNYRSEKSLVNALNTLFALPNWMPLPKKQSALEIMPVAASEKAEEDSLGVLEKESPRGSLHFLLIETSSSLRDRFPIETIQEKQIVPFLAAEISNLQKTNLFPLSRIALLVKDRNQATHLIEELKKYGLSAVFIRSEGLINSPVFVTILALLRAVNAPHDTYLLKHFLLSPLINWSQDELVETEKRGHLLEHFSVMQGLKELFQTQGLANCLQKAFSLTTWKLFDKLFSEKKAALYEDFLQIQELLFEEANQGKRSLAQLIACLEELRFKDPDENKHLQRRVTESNDAVTIMTMHASKGLEFDIVFALGLAIRTTHDEDADPKEKDAEKMRLLYVTKTRAKRRLYVPLLIDKKQVAFKPGLASPAELFFARFGRLIDNYSDWLAAGAFLTMEKVQQTLNELSSNASITWEVIGELTADCVKHEIAEIVSLPPPQNFLRFWKREEIVSFSSLFQKPLQSLYSVPSLEESELPLGSETGNLIHGIMEEIFRNEWQCPLASTKIQAFIEQITYNTKFAGYNGSILAMIIAALQLPLFSPHPGGASFSLQEIPGKSLLPEMEFCYFNGAQFRKGFIDLCFVHEEFYYLIDWKTNWLPQYDDKSCDAVMQHQGYRLQAALYADALRRYVKLFDNRPFATCFGGAHYLFMRGKKWESFMPESV